MDFKFKPLNYLMAMAVVLFSGLALASCSDDDDDDNGQGGASGPMAQFAGLWETVSGDIITVGGDGTITWYDDMDDYRAKNSYATSRLTAGEGGWYYIVDQQGETRERLRLLSATQAVIVWKEYTTSYQCDGSDEYGRWDRWDWVRR